MGVVSGILLGFATHQPLFAVAMGMGAMSTGFAELQGIYRTRLATMMAMAFAMALSTILGSAAGHWIPLEIAALAVWGAAYGLFSSLGSAASAIGLNATIALIIFSNFPQAPTPTLECGAFVVAGGLIQTALLVFSWPVQRYPEERSALSAVYSSLRSYVATLDCEKPTLPPSSSLAAVRTTLADPRPFGRRVAFAAFQTLSDEAERIRMTLGRIAVTNCSALLGARATVSRALDEIATSLREGKPPEDETLRAELDEESGDEDLRALFGQLRAAWRNASVPLQGRSLGTSTVARIEWFDLAESLAILRSNASLDAPFGRHAVRVALTLTLTGILAHVLPIQKGYWMSLTAA
ncbi:MAG: hypothetical protein JOZ01_01555, partial [Candidatus Eremiobacteraeota bacterium]|nr:hypothetical protein [Candidatus Eremiobacteraeota bacterium]